MDAEELVDRATWEVVLKIKTQELLTDWRNGRSLVFGHPTENQKNILFLLQDNNAIKLLNLSRFVERPSIQIASSMPEEIKLEVVQPKFDEIYEAYKKEYTLQRDFTPANPSTIKAKIKEVITVTDIKGKEKKFLMVLSDGKPKSIKTLTDEIKTKSCKSIKSSVQKKIKGKGLKIKTTKATGFQKESFYTIELLTE